MWLDNLGLEIPTTIAEREVGLTACKEQDADGDGDVNDEIPFTGRYNFNKDAFQNWAFCWGLSVNGAYCYIQDGQVVDFVQTDAYCDCLETLHRWYANGLIDVEAVTQDANTVMSKLKTGQVGCFFRGPFLRTTWVNMPISTFPSCCPPPSKVCPPGVCLPVQPDHGVSLTSMAAERGEEHIAAVCRWLDSVYDFENMVSARWGVKGENWDYDENGRVVRIADGSANEGCWLGGRALFYGVAPDLYVNKIVLSENSKAIQELFRMYQDAGYLEVAPYRFVFDVIPWTTETSAAFKLTYTEPVKFIDEYSCKFVANGITDGEWEAYLDACDALTVDNYVDEMNAADQTYLQGIGQ